MDLAGRHVVVTGAARGIGQALAARVHQAGAQVVLADRLDPSEAAGALPGSIGIVADVGTEAGNVELIRAAEAAFGPIDLFFANAGIGSGGDPMTDEEVWEQSFAVNVHAHRWAARHLLPAWLERGEGYFCSTASAAGLLAQIGSAPYSVTKHAALAFAEWLSITYGDRGLRVSCLCPQGVNTDMLRAGDDGVGATGTEVVKAAGVVLEPAEVAQVVYRAIVDEQFLILPHPEVAEYVRRKAADPERWLAGMRAFQRRFV
jgi:NAD(P)-dependent dehydrogenase (short-subunit alcohol dehydrogenase family)